MFPTERHTHDTRCQTNHICIIIIIIASPDGGAVCPQKKKFTPVEIKNSEATPYTLRVTEDSISKAWI